MFCENTKQSRRALRAHRESGATCGVFDYLDSMFLFYEPRRNRAGTVLLDILLFCLLP